MSGPQEQSVLAYFWLLFGHSKFINPQQWQSKSCPCDCSLPLGVKTSSFPGSKNQLFTSLCLYYLLVNAFFCWTSYSLMPTEGFEAMSQCFYTLPHYNELVFINFRDSFPCQKENVWTRIYTLHLMRFLLNIASFCSCRYCLTPGFRFCATT